MSVWNQYGQWTFTKLRFKSQLSTSWLIWHRNLKCKKSTITRVLWPTAFLSSFCSRTWGTRWRDLYLLNVSYQRFLHVGILPLTLASWPTNSPSHSRSTSRHRLQVCFQWQNSDFATTNLRLNLRAALVAPLQTGSVQSCTWLYLCPRPQSPRQWKKLFRNNCSMATINVNLMRTDIRLR